MDTDNAATPTELETLIANAAGGTQSEQDALINGFLNATVFVPTATEPSEGQLVPILADVDGVPHLLVCDSLDSVTSATDLAKRVASVRGIDAVRGTPEGHAILVKTAKNGFGIPEPLIREIRRRFAASSDESPNPEA